MSDIWQHRSAHTEFTPSSLLSLSNMKKRIAHMHSQQGSEREREREREIDRESGTVGDWVNGREPPR